MDEKAKKAIIAALIVAAVIFFLTRFSGAIKNLLDGIGLGSGGIFDDPEKDVEKEREKGIDKSKLSYPLPYYGDMAAKIREATSAWGPLLTDERMIYDTFRKCKTKEDVEMLQVAYFNSYGDSLVRHLSYEMGPDELTSIIHVLRANGVYDAIIL